MALSKFNLFLFVGLLGALAFSISHASSSEEYSRDVLKMEVQTTSQPDNSPKVIHLETPEPLKAIYMTSCIASLPKERSRLVKLIEDTELNSLVIDIKDYTGIVSFHTGNENIDKVSLSAKGCRVDDMQEFVRELHEKKIYVIGRVTVFQDPLYTKMYPEVAVKSKKTGSAWKDRKGLAFIDVGAKKYWDHVVAIATSSSEIGFDEINFDYIRFPSDGDMSDANHTHSIGKSKREAVREFFEYIGQEMRTEKIITSADLFGMTTTNSDDLGIGQVLEYALMNFDYVAPMVYPSHYPANFNGWKDPNKVPYELIKYVMLGGVEKVNRLHAEVSTSTASSTPDRFLSERVNKLQLRPWLQDFDYPVPYTVEMVRGQVQATYDAGLTSWMLWDPSNKYTREALLGN